MKKLYLPSSGKELSIEECKRCGHEMVNVDKDELKEVDAQLLNLLAIRWSNPRTEESICIRCDILKRFGFEEEKEERPKPYIPPPSISRPASPGSIFGGGFGGFSGGFGGFSGGSFGGAGASR